MTISKLYFWIIIISIFVFLFYRLGVLGDNKENSKKANFILLTGVSMLAYLGIMFYGYFPNIYVIDSCDEYHKEILIFPKTTEKGLNLNYGDEHCYVLNESNYDINVKTLVYAKPDYDPLIFFKTYNEILNAKTEKKFEIGKFHFVCEKPDSEVFSKGSQSFKYSINCN